MKKILFVIVLAAIFCSCRTTRKITDTEKNEIEFISETNEDSSGVKTENTTTVTVTDQEDNTTIVADFEAGENDSLGLEDAVLIDKETGNISIKGKLKKLTVKQNTNVNIKDSTVKQAKDTASKTTTGKTEFKQVEEKKHTDTERKGFFQIIARPAVIILLIIGAIWFFFFYLKRKRK
jgi:hypothetical protein